MTTAISIVISLSTFPHKRVTRKIDSIFSGYGEYTIYARKHSEAAFARGKTFRLLISNKKRQCYSIFCVPNRVEHS